MWLRYSRKQAIIYEPCLILKQMVAVVIRDAITISILKEIAIARIQKMCGTNTKTQYCQERKKYCFRGMTTPINKRLELQEMAPYSTNKDRYKSIATPVKVK